jgi:hypothetical protein
MTNIIYQLIVFLGKTVTRAWFGHSMGQKGRCKCCGTETDAAAHLCGPCIDAGCSTFDNCQL